MVMTQCWDKQHQIITEFIIAYLPISAKGRDKIPMAAILLSPTQRLVLQEACKILKDPPEGFTQDLWPRYLIGDKGSISTNDLGLFANHFPSIIDRLLSASNELFLVELAMRISDKDTPFDQAIEDACRYLVTGGGNNA